VKKIKNLVAIHKGHKSGTSSAYRTFCAKVTWFLPDHRQPFAATSIYLAQILDQETNLSVGIVLHAPQVVALVL
jgi:hypothetical protein